jgi:RNA polymerase sigma-70 factor, ECF subfamily
MVVSLAMTEPIPELARLDQDRAHAVVTAEFAFVWRLVRRLGVPQDSVDDVTQQVFLVLWRRLHDVIPGQERSFLFSTVVRTVSEYRRKPFRRSEVQSDDEVQDSSPDPEQLLQMRRDREALDRLLDALPMEQRTVFVLYELEELTLSGISELLGIPQGTVTSRLRLARERVEQGAGALVSSDELAPSQEGR